MSFGEWFDQYPGPYCTIANAVLIGFVALALWRPAPTRVAPARLDRVYAAAIFITLFIWRWPVFIVPHPLNPDEGQMIASALKATVDIVPWRGFDLNTSGPLNADVLVLAALVGAHIDFFSARIIGVLLIGGAIYALFRAIAWQFEGETARVCAAPLVVFLALTRQADFAQYSSEYLSIFLTTVALACAVSLSYRPTSPRVRFATAAIGGMCLGCTLFSKLQATPMAAILFAYLIAAIWLSENSVTGRRAATIGAAFAGALAPIVVILGSVLLFGERHDFLISYLLSSVSYVNDGESGITPMFYFTSAFDYCCYAYSSIAVFVACVLALTVAGIRRKIVAPVNLALAAAALLMLATFFTIYEPHRAFPHYLLFSLVPATWLLANLFGPAYRLASLDVSRNAIRAAYVLVFAVPTLSSITGYADKYLQEMPVSGTFPKSAVATAIGQYVPRGGRIAIWGWMPEYYVESGTIMATRDAHTQHDMVANPYEAYFQNRFMADIRASRPTLILDAVFPGAFGFDDNAKNGIGSFAPLAEYVRSDYTLVQIVGGVKIYRRRPDR